METDIIALTEIAMEELETEQQPNRKTFQTNKSSKKFQQSFGETKRNLDDDDLCHCIWKLIGWNSSAKIVYKTNSAAGNLWREQVKICIYIARYRFNSWSYSQPVE